MQTLLNTILPVFVVVAAGYMLTWRKVFPEPGIDALMRFAQLIAIPCLLFLAMARLDLAEALSWGLLISFYTGAATCFALGIFGGRLLTKRPWEDCVAIGFCCLFSNSVLLGLPLVERAFGAVSLQGAFAIVAFHAPFCYALGITTMEAVLHRGEAIGQLIRSVANAMFRNVLVVAIALGALVNVSGITLPTPLTDGLDLIARAGLPVALFALGGVLTRYRPEGDSRAIAMVCVLALLVHPAIALTIGTASAVPPVYLQAAVLTAAMPPGINSFIFADMYGRARRVAASSILIATALSIFTAWGWLFVLGPPGV